MGVEILIDSVLHKHIFSGAEQQFGLLLFILCCENYTNKASVDFFMSNPVHRFLEDEGIFKIFFCAPYNFYFC
jgi:hypothetical protein